jgi:ribonucleoside-diphosphate reductase alpha chain
MDMLSRVKEVTSSWVRGGHQKGQNSHNVSATVTIKDDEWDMVGEWMWNNREFYNGLSVLPFSDHTYKQAPFEDCTEEQYHEMLKSLKEINLDNVSEEEDQTNLSGELACAGGSCEIF